MKTRHLLMTATLAVGIAMTGMMMTSCAKVDNPVEELDGAPGAGGDKVAGNWTYRVSGNDVILTGYIGADKDTLTTLNIPLTVDGKYVTYIATSYGVKFSDFKNLETLKFDNSSHIDVMPYLGGCTKLEHVNSGEADCLPKYMNTVGNNAFEGTAIKKIIFPNTVSSVGDKVFRNCDSLESVNIINANVSLGEDAFAHIPSKCTVTLKCSMDKLTWRSVSYSPQILVNCSDGAIGWCGDDGDSPQDFLYWTFKKDTLTIACPQQGIDNFPEDKRVIKTRRWYDYKNKIKTLILKDVYGIGDGSFYDMINLQSVTLNDGLMFIGDDAFYGCYNLKTINSPASLMSIGDHAFYNCKSLEAITIPDKLTSILKYTFYNCNSLKAITIPDKVEDIGEYAFYNCNSLETITIPFEVEWIGEYAFYYCTNLQTVYIDGIPEIGKNAFPRGAKIIGLPDDNTEPG